MQATRAYKENSLPTMKFEPSYAENERPLSPIFEIKEAHIRDDTPAHTIFDENSRTPKIKAEPVCSLPCQSYTDAMLPKPWLDAIPTSIPGNPSRSSPINNADTHEDESTRTPSTSQAESSTPAASVSLPKSSPLPPVQSQSVITEASTTSQNITEQSRPIARPLSNPQCRQTSSKPRWSARQKEVQRVIKQRTKEWKEKQALYQFMRNAAARNPAMGYQKRGKDPIAFTIGREKHPGDNIIQRSAFNWYPGFVPPTIRSYPYHMNGYPIMAEYDGKLPTGSTDLGLKRRHSSGVSSDAEQVGSLSGGKQEPVIKEVVSLADTTSSSVGERHVEYRRSKRVRKSIDEPSPLERRESIDSGNSETDGDLLNSSGKYISDFAETFQNTPEDHQVAHINGLLSLPSSRETRYGITYGELKRRCGGPEYLSRVDLVAYVRHSKSSGRGLLDKYKIVSANRSSKPTIMSKMCENEARVLGDGILRMNMDYFPGKVLAESATEGLKKNPDTDNQNEEKGGKWKSKIREKMRDIEITRSMLKEVFDLLLSEKDHEEMQRFELASHTFGTVNLKNHLTLFDRFFQEYQTSLEASVEADECAT